MNAASGVTTKGIDEEMSFDENGHKQERMGTRKHPVAYGRTNRDLEDGSGIGSGVKSLEANGKKGK